MLGCQLVQFAESFSRESSSQFSMHCRCDSVDVIHLSRISLTTASGTGRRGPQEQTLIKSSLLCQGLVAETDRKRRSLSSIRYRHSSRGTLGCRIVSCAKTPDLRTTWRLPRDVRVKTFSTHDTLLSAAGKLEQAWNGWLKIIRTIHAEPGASGC